MGDFSVLKQANYGKNICTQTEGGVIFFEPDSLKEVGGAETMIYDEYLDVQFQSMGKMRAYFEMCYFHCKMKVRGQFERMTKNTTAQKSIYQWNVY